MRLLTRAATAGAAALLATGVVAVTDLAVSPASAATASTVDGQRVEVHLTNVETLFAAEVNPTAGNICRDYVAPAFPAAPLVPFDQGWCEAGVHDCARRASDAHWATSSVVFERIVVLDLTTGAVSSRDKVTCGS